MKSQSILVLPMVVLFTVSVAKADILYNIIDLGTLPGAHWSGAYSINRTGDIVGSADNASGNRHATMFDPTGVGNNIDLRTLGGDLSFSTSINDKGQIVGIADTGSGDRHATLFDPSGGGNNIDLGTLGGSDSSALSINNSGQIVGWATTASSPYTQATLFDPTGGGL